MTTDREPFSPGPWTDRKFGDTKSNSLYDANNIGIATIGAKGKFRNPERQAANARLIAKAPEMFEILVECYPIVNNLWASKGVESGLADLHARIQNIVGEVRGGRVQYSDDASLGAMVYDNGEG